MVPSDDLHLVMSSVNSVLETLISHGPLSPLLLSLDKEPWRRGAGELM